MKLRAAPLALLGLLVGTACGNTLYLSSSSPSPSSSTEPSATAVGATATPFEPLGELFFAYFGSVPPPFHVTLETTLSGSPGGTARTEADVDGADYTAMNHLEITGADPHDSQIVVVDGTGYVADAGSSDWRAYPDYETTPPVNPFLDLDPAAWSELGPDPGHGGLDRLNSTAWRLPADSSLADRVKDVSIDVWIDTNGYPVLAELRLTLPAVDQLSEVSYRARYSFSRIGNEVIIVPPTVMPSGT